MTIAINGSGTITGISVGGLNDNIITKNEMATGGAWAPAGTVLQVVNVAYSTITSSTANSYTDTGLSATITPASTTSKILVFVDLNGCYKSANNGLISFKLLRGATSLYTTDSLVAYTASSTEVSVGSSSTNYLDSPASSSPVTYKVQMKNGTAAGTVYINNYSSGETTTSTMTLMEIAA